MYFSQALKGKGLSYISENPDVARHYLTQASINDNADYEIPMFIGDSYGKDTRNAKPYYKEALVRLESVRPQSVSDRINKSKMLEKIGYTEAALSNLETLQKTHPQNAEIRLALAQLALDRRNPDGALIVLNTFDESTTGLSAVDRRNLVFSRAEAYRQKGHWQSAYKTYREYAKKFPTDYYNKLFLADLLNQTGGWPTALDLLHQIIDADVPLALREQANELIATIHADRGNSIGYEFVFSGINPELNFRNRVETRYFIAPSVGLYISGDHNFVDDKNGFSKGFGDFGLKTRFWIFPNWDVAVNFVRTINHLGSRTTEIGAESRLRVAGGQLTARAYKDQVWDEPLSTVANLGG